MTEENISVLYPDGSKTPGTLVLGETEFTVVTDGDTITVPLSELISCRRDRKRDTACRVTTKSRMAYTFIFQTEKKMLRFLAMLDAQCEDLTISARKAAKRLPKRLIALVTAACILIAALGVGGYFLIDFLVPHYGSTDITTRSNYSVTSAKPGSWTMNRTVAVGTDGEELITNAELQVLFWMDVYQFMNNYSSYLSYVGLSASKPLSAQSATDGRTWEQYFLETTTINFQNYYAMGRAAEKDGFELPEEWVKKINDVTDPDGEFAAEAAKEGFSDIDAYLQEQFGDGVNLVAYQNYLRFYYTAMAYYDNVIYANAQKSFTDEQVEEEYTKNAETTYSKYPKVNNVSVRHILIQPEGEKDTTSDSGSKTWSTSAWSVAESKANEVYALWKENPTVDYFAELAKEYTKDTNGDKGGLYEDVAPGQMIDEFNDWIFDEARKDGDSAIVKTAYGYHIIYFVGRTETRAWFEAAKGTLVSAMTTEHLKELNNEYPVRYDFSRMRIFDIIYRNNNKKTETAEK